MGITSPLQALPLDRAGHRGRQPARGGRRLRHLRRRRRAPRAAGDRQGGLPQRPRAARDACTASAPSRPASPTWSTRSCRATRATAPRPPCRTTTRGVAAGKTGTTTNSADAWFCGFDPKLATAVWMGYPQAEVPMPGVQGATYCVPIWGTYYEMVFGSQADRRLRRARRSCRSSAVDRPLRRWPARRLRRSPRVLHPAPPRRRPGHRPRRPPRRPRRRLLPPAPPQRARRRDADNRRSALAGVRPAGAPRRSQGGRPIVGASRRPARLRLAGPPG